MLREDNEQKSRKVSCSARLSLPCFHYLMICHCVRPQSERFSVHGLLRVLGPSVRVSCDHFSVEDTRHKFIY